MTRQIKIFDTTLRDGEQSPGCSMNIEEKIKVAKQLEKLGVDIIEAGFAISSKGDFGAIEKIAQEVKSPIICSLSRAIKADIETAAHAIRQAENQRIHTFIATSPIHMEYKLKMSEDKVIETAVNAVKHAKSFVSDVEFSCEDAGRSEKEFLVKIINETIKAGATVINIPDTVGYLTPNEYGELIYYLSQNVTGIEKVDLSVHCHNDLGFATANALAGVLNGASQIECTINGIGERAGNTALEEIAMAIKVREDIIGCHTQINCEEIYKASRLVTNITGSVVQANKAIVGANAFAHEAGIHQDGFLKKRQTYEIMSPTMIGLKESQLVLGKHSGRHAFVDKLKELGITLDENDINKAFERFKQLADKKKDIQDEDIESIVNDEVSDTPESIQLNAVKIVSDSTDKPIATVSLNKDGKTLEDSQNGAGSVDAIYNTIHKILGENFELVDYIVQAVTGGTDALGEVVVRLQENGRIFTGRGASLDVLTASTKAYINAVNKLLSARNTKQIKP